MSLRQRVPVRRPGRLGDPDRHELAGMVPFIGGGRQVEPVIALQPHQPAVQPARQHLGDLGLAGARLALQEQRPPHRQRQMHGGGQRQVGDIAAGGQQGGGVRDALPAALEDSFRTAGPAIPSAQHQPDPARSAGSPNGSRGIMLSALALRIAAAAGRPARRCPPPLPPAAADLVGEPVEEGVRHLPARWRRSAGRRAAPSCRRPGRSPRRSARVPSPSSVSRTSAPPLAKPATPPWPSPAMR